MLYSILIYDSQAEVATWSKEKDDAMVARHVEVQKDLAKQGKLGPVVRLLPTERAATLRSGAERFVTDGPYTETKEALLGLYVVDCATLEEAVGIARRLPNESGMASFEVRPVCWYEPGVPMQEVK